MTPDAFNDCAPGQILNTFAGGIEYLGQVFSTGQLVQEDMGVHDLYSFESSGSEQKYFQPKTAILGAFCASLLVFTILVICSKHKNPRTSHK